MQVSLVVFDWAGTVIDFGSCAPAASFVSVFEEHGVRVSHAEARKPMGTHKKDHLRIMLQDDNIRRRWRDKHGHDWTENDLELMYSELVPKQLKAIHEHDSLV